ncbi:MAG: hypothetical protein RJB62_644 [Pseudomonadota bacterium]
MNLLERYESVAQSYVRTAPIVYERARGAEIFDENGARYIDFHSGGGTLTLGHNNFKVCSALIDYLCKDGVTQTREKASVAKRSFVEAFVTNILTPRGLDYRFLFAEPAHGVAAELALRLARRERKRSNVIAFTNSYHGLTEGALSVGSRHATRYESIDLRRSTVFMPYCGYFGAGVDTIAYLQKHLEDAASGVELPAAVIVEAVQYDAGVQVASPEWLNALAQLCRKFDVLLVVDETQIGCGRTGPFFSFERAGIVPDIVIAPVALAGGYPLSFLLIRPDLDHWRPGEQMGLLQGGNVSLIAAAELAAQWSDDVALTTTPALAKLISERLHAMAARYPQKSVSVRGIGMLHAMEFERAASAAVVSSWALERGLLVEPAGLRDQVLLIAPPVTIEEKVLREGLDRLDAAVSMFLSHE